jgi:anti-sigma regulatory factor (Ser/Thr protein kinase)
MASASFDIRRDTTAPAHARRAIERLRDRIDPEIAPQVTLLVSELVTNAVKYGRDDDITLRIEFDDSSRLRVEVVDHGEGFVPVARDRPATDVGGWGLHLVQALSDRWGVCEGLARVWFEIDRRDDGVMAAAAA